MDLLLRAEAVLTSNPAVARRLSARFRYIFVDEFQDTDPLQAEVPAGAGRGGSPGRLFVVGDPKQSIYGFRRADIQVYRKFRKEMVDAGRGGRPALPQFPQPARPARHAQRPVLPHPVRAREDFSPPYTPVDPHRTDPGEGHPVSLYELAPDVDEAKFLAGLVRGIVGSVKVRGGDGVERPARLRDIAVLYRSDASGEVLSGYRNALSAAGIPNIVPSRKGFFLRQEIQDFRIVLSAVDVPADTAARHAALKTIFFGLSDAEILPLYGSEPAGVPPRGETPAALLSRLSARRGRASLPDLRGAALRGDGGRFRGGAPPGRGAGRAEPVEGGGDGPRVRVGGAGVPPALPRGGPPEDVGRAGGGRGARLRGRTRTPSASPPSTRRRGWSSRW